MTKNDENLHVTAKGLSPFEAARLLQVEVNYYKFPNYIYGLYTPDDHVAAQILINESISLEKQEKVCEYFVAHHIEHDNLAAAYCIDDNTYAELEKRKRILPYPQLQHGKWSTRLS